MRLLVALLVLPMVLFGQGGLEDYRRSFGLRDRYADLAVNLPERATWIEGGTKFWYRKTVKGGGEFVIVDASSLEKKPAFDHTRLAEGITKATGEKVGALNLPFTSFNFVDGGRGITFQVGQVTWRASLADYAVSRVSPPQGRGGQPFGGGLALPGRNQLGQPDRVIASPDGKWEALVRNYNLAIREKGKSEIVPLSFEGSEGNYYATGLIVWSPDSAKIAAYRIRPGFQRQIHFIESSPSDQLQPKHSVMDYAKPGDVLDLQQPVIFHVASRKQIAVDNALFPNPYQLSRPVWRRDSNAFTFEYNQRGHQVFRVIEVSAESGNARAVISEEPKTFFCYSSKRFRHDIADGREIVWMSERDGWNHLYLYDGLTGKVKNQITKGEWVVRGVEKVDEEKRQIWFTASGMYPDKDPYFLHYYRINFDGTGLTAFTRADANHSVAFSPDMKFYVDTYSRVDMPPVSELHRTEDARLVAEIERGDISALTAAGWRAPEVFVSKARDGKTDIWGIIVRPSNFDASKKYPVVEQIYAGPHGSFVPKSFFSAGPVMALAELGFIVVQIDGMGTNNRSKAFHDVSWKNLADAGFPDRILWHKAVAAKYPYYDITRVGVYGHSAGGQNALGALLFHGDFYKAAVSSCGCHDNRMDKIWWNEQWMGWPIGPEYIACSNVENAHRLKGKLLLSVGELDNNVDPASTMQVVNALVKAGKTFEFLVLPGQGHSNGGAYGDRKRADFFVRHLLGKEPPDWNLLDEKLPQPPVRR